VIYILGGGGFVGSAFARYCEDAGHEYRVLDRANYREYAGTSCRLFINANGNSRKPLAARAPLDDFDASVRSVRSSLTDFSAERYLHLSSCDVYADCSSPETSGEETAIDFRGQSPYGFHKWLAEQCVRYGAKRWMILRLGGMVGPGLKKNAIFDIVNGEKLWLDPESRLQFMNTADVAKAAFGLLARELFGEVFNVCGRGTVSLKEAMACAGKREMQVQPRSPLVTYEVDIEKAGRHLPLPSTKDTVFDFIAGQGLK
jgi:nucleoside-diphosphate-sugar epimerase